MTATLSTLIRSGHVVVAPLVAPRALDAAGWTALASLVAAWVVTLLTAPAVPLQDVAEWVYQGWLLERRVAGDPRSAIVTLVPYPVPNTLVTALAAALVPTVGAELSVRLLALLALAAAAIGCAALAHAARAGGWVATMLFAIIGLSTPFLLGYVAFVLAMGLLAMALAADLGRRLDRRAVVGWSLLLFFVHAIPFLVFVLAIGWRHVVLLRLRASALALLPSLALALWYAGARLVASEAAIAPIESDGGWLQAAWEQLRWKPFTAAAAGGWRELRIDDVAIVALDALGTHWMIAFNLLFGAALVAVVSRALARRVALGEIAPTRLLPAIALLFLFLATPPVDFFGLINAGERFWLAACLLLLPLARPRPAIVAALMLTSVPAHTLNLASIWRAGAGDPVAIELQASATPWHPYIVPLGTRLVLLDRIADDDLRPLDRGYDTGILRNR
jgi:hypothetical protein